MKLKNILMFVGATTAAYSVVACDDDRDDELTSMTYSRLLAPVGIDASVRNSTNIRITWTEVNGAESYIVEAFANDSTNAFSGTADVRIEDILFEDLPYTITGLDGETYYAVRVMAVASESSKNSKWNAYLKSDGEVLKTSGESILLSVSDEDITSDGATIRWTSGLTVTSNYIVVTKDGEEVKRVTLTAEDNENGYVVLSGLNSESTYKVILYKELTDKTISRGSQNFKTAIDLGNAIPVNPGDDIKQIIADAEDGATLAFYPGVYNILSDEGENSKIEISKNIAFKSVRATDRAVINGCIHLLAGASFEAEKIVFDGAKGELSEEEVEAGYIATDGSQVFEWKDADMTYVLLKLTDCEVMRYTKGVCYGNAASTINEVVFDNCIIHDIECSGGDLFDCRKSYIKELTLVNNTIYNSAAARSFIRYDNNISAFGDENTCPTTITIENNTICNVGTDDTSTQYFMYVRWGNVKESIPQTIIVKNNLISGFKLKRGYTTQKTTGEITFSNNYYYDCLNLVSIAADNTEAITQTDSEGTELGATPFRDAANADFTIVNEDFTTSDNHPGASRWY